MPTSFVTQLTFSLVFLMVNVGKQILSIPIRRIPMYILGMRFQLIWAVSNFLPQMQCALCHIPWVK